MKKKRKDDSSEYLHSSPPTKSRRLLLLNSEITMEMKMEEDTHANVLPQKKKSNEEERCTHLIPGLKALIILWNVDG
ncbi:hypothetical protein L195_g043037 [Trifolium pratense]|uniref:Uncharacterized protein n=1 Tax=Trifolium pratense TaxID=57577 RepID=A0A2K3M846_TRIPR|nr:hypothetical protein L195_g034086 [Trifolium pratense]PNX86954.1 hypothetical protein L195_g043037 [Trifolium pratense]